MHMEYAHALYVHGICTMCLYQNVHSSTHTSGDHPAVSQSSDLHQQPCNSFLYTGHIFWETSFFDQNRLRTPGTLAEPKVHFFDSLAGAIQESPNAQNYTIQLAILSPTNAISPVHHLTVNWENSLFTQRTLSYHTCTLSGPKTCTFRIPCWGHLVVSRCSELHHSTRHSFFFLSHIFCPPSSCQFKNLVFGPTTPPHPPWTLSEPKTCTFGIPCRGHPVVSQCSKLYHSTRHSFPFLSHIFCPPSDCQLGNFTFWI